MKKGKKHILMVIERFSPLIGGAETQCYQLSSGFVKKGFEVTIATKRWPDSLKKKERFKEGFVVHRLGLAGKNRFNDYLSSFLLIFFFLARIRRIDAVYINGGLANCFGSTAIILGKIFRKKIIAKVETPGELCFSGEKALSPKKFVHPLIKIRLFWAKKPDYFVAQTKLVREDLLELGIDENKIINITNSVDEFVFSPAGEREKKRLKKLFFQNEKLFVACFCGRLVERKGLKFLFDSWKEVGKKENLLIIIGSGDNQPDSVEKNLRQKQKDEGIENIIFLGSKTKQEIIGLLRACDIFVYPSIHPEGTALSVLEAMSCGLPAVVSDIGGLNDVVENNSEGLLVPPGNSDLLKQAIWFLSNDLEKRKQMGKKAREKILKVYSTEIIVEKYLKFFNEKIFK